jgi:hypothetical protein
LQPVITLSQVLGRSNLPSSAICVATPAAGARGPVGSIGLQGAPAPLGPVVQVDGPITTLAAGTDSDAIGSSVAFCPAGDEVISGGYSAIEANAVFESESFGVVGWVALGDNFASTTTGTVQAFASCAPEGEAIAASLQEPPSWLRG